MHIFCYHFRVCILITDFCRAGNDTGNVIFIHFYKGIYHVFVVLVNIMSHVIHDMLSSYSFASFATIPVSVSYLQTSLERSMSREMLFFFTYTNGICHVFVVLVNILPPVIHDLLSSYPCASFATIPVSVSQLQTSVTREMSREM